MILVLGRTNRRVIIRRAKWTDKGLRTEKGVGQEIPRTGGCSARVVMTLKAVRDDSGGCSVRTVSPLEAVVRGEVRKGRFIVSQKCCSAYYGRLSEEALNKQLEAAVWKLRDVCKHHSNNGQPADNEYVESLAMKADRIADHIALRGDIS